MTGWTPIGWLLVAYAGTYVATESGIALPLRLKLVRRVKSFWLTALLYCPACMGWWSGLVVAGVAMALGHTAIEVAWLPFASLVAGSIRAMLPHTEAQTAEFEVVEWEAQREPWPDDANGEA